MLYSCPLPPSLLSVFFQPASSNSPSFRLCAFLDAPWVSGACGKHRQVNKQLQAALHDKSIKGEMGGVAEQTQEEHITSWGLGQEVSGRFSGASDV